MCLAFPGKILKIENNIALVDFNGVQRSINIDFITPKIGDYILAHTDYAIEIIEPEEAQKRIELQNKLIKKS